MITSEKRFGPKFSTGREEEPGPTAYKVQTNFELNAARAQKSPQKVGFGTDARDKPPSKPVDYGAYNPEIPGAFPNVYTTEQWQAQQKLNLEETRRTRISPRSPPPRVQLAAGPGSYQTELDMLKNSTDFHFSKAKRLGLTEYMQKRGEVGASPGPKYLPQTDSIALRCAPKAILHRQAQVSKAATSTLEKSFQDIDKSCQRLTHAIASPSLWSPSGRLNLPSDSKLSGPGSYEQGTAFVKKTTKRGTFGTAKQMDMLSNLLAAGHVGDTPVGPGQYNVDTETFKSKTYNTRGGYRSPPKNIHMNIQPLRIELKETSRMFDAGIDSSSLSAREIWNTIRKAPDPKKLGYDNGVPNIAQNRKKATTTEPPIYVPPAEPTIYESLDVQDPAQKIDTPVELNEELNAAEPLPQLELPPECEDATSFAL